MGPVIARLCWLWLLKPAVLGVRRNCILQMKQLWLGHRKSKVDCKAESNYQSHKASKNSLMRVVVLKVHRNRRTVDIAASHCI